MAQTTPANNKVQKLKVTAPPKAIMSSDQQAKMIANIIAKHLDTSIEEAYRYSSMISEYIPWSPLSKKMANKPPVPYATCPTNNKTLPLNTKGNNNNGPKSFTQVMAEQTSNSNPWQTVKCTPISRPTFRGTSNKLVKVSLKNSAGIVIPSMANLHTLSGMKLIHDIEDLICLALSGQNLLLKKAILWCSWSSNDTLTVYFNSNLTDKEIELITLTLGGQAAVAIKAPNISFVKFMNIPTIDQSGKPINIQDYMECIQKDTKWKDIKIFKTPYYATPLKNPNTISAPIKISIINDEKGSQAAKIKQLNNAQTAINGDTPLEYAAPHQTVLNVQAII
ncbi:hypothetical protein AX17_005129 [Amanita inopinata Kibby_2008]|nr:hypothetical protein AX17_005129 [Amanita inopinata Kibby_2008]